MSGAVVFLQGIRTNDVTLLIIFHGIAYLDSIVVYMLVPKSFFLIFPRQLK